MALRYVGRLDELTPDRVRNLRSRLRRTHDVWDAQAERLAERLASKAEDQTGLAVAYEVDPRPTGSILGSLVKWQSVAALAAGALLGLLIAGVIWWNMRETRKAAKGKAGGKRKRKAA